MPRLGASPGSALIPGWVVEAFYWSFHAPARALVRLGASPDAITYVSLALSLASLPLVATGRFGAAAAVIVVGAVLDALDGMVARESGAASARGAVLDSCVDRLSDAAPLAGLAIFYRGSAIAMAVPIAAMVVSSLVSYARAKADIYKLSLPNGVMRRHERITILVAALLLGPLVPHTTVPFDLPCPITLAGIFVIAVLGLMAAVLLVRRTRAALATAESSFQSRMNHRGAEDTEQRREKRDSDLCGLCASAVHSSGRVSGGRD
jgi:CDP-diacylglycerol--glycerol-3-phosphate 3-phosphatidyltransferase